MCDYFEKELDCSYHYTDAYNIFINTNPKVVLLMKGWMK